MQIIEQDGKITIKCECGFRIYEPDSKANGIYVLKTRIALINKLTGHICIKCPKCKRFDDSIDIDILLK